MMEDINGVQAIEHFVLPNGNDLYYSLYKKPAGATIRRKLSVSYDFVPWDVWWSWPEEVRLRPLRAHLCGLSTEEGVYLRHCQLWAKFRIRPPDQLEMDTGRGWEPFVWGRAGVTRAREASSAS
jgi:hypothetical protein